MRENRLHGSEGGVAKAIPTPIRDAVIPAPVGAALYRTMAEGGTSTCGRNLGGTHPGHAASWRSRALHGRGVVSPVLANLFLHYAFDAWMARTFPGVPCAGMRTMVSQTANMALQDGGRGAGHQGGARSPASAMRPRNASWQDTDCLLQGRKSEGAVPEYEVRLPRVLLQAEGGEEQQA